MSWQYYHGTGERNQRPLRYAFGMKVAVMEYRDEWKYLREKITRLRKGRGMSIQALADYANMDRSSLSRIESGKVASITFETLCKIAEALEVPPGELVRR
jgi:DNA-binding Xre family transcriptional regulator